MGLPDVDKGRGHFPPLCSLCLIGSLGSWLVDVCIVVAVSEQGPVVCHVTLCTGVIKAAPATPHTSTLGIPGQGVFACRAE